MDLYQQYIHISRYSRWRDDLGRRETNVSQGSDGLFSLSFSHKNRV